MQNVADRKCLILPWREDDFSTNNCIRHLSQFPMKISEITNYILRFFVQGLLTKCLQIYLDHCKEFQLINRGMRG